jgi:hypothetical protein
MTSAATIRRSATLLGAILTALTLTGPAFGQTVLGGVGSTVEATTESVQPVTEAVGGVTAQATAPVTGSQPEQTAAPVESTVQATASDATAAVESTASAATRPVQAAAAPVVEAAARTTKTVTRTARVVTTPVEQAVEPVVRTAVATVTRTLEAARATTTETLLGPLVDRIDAQAEELPGPFRPSATTMGWTPVTGETPVADRGPADEPANAGRTRPGGPAADAKGLVPATPSWLRAPAGPAGDTSAGRTPHPAPVSAPNHTRAPSQPFSAGGSGTGASPVVAVLAGLLALALAASLGRLLPWSDVVRPLAFVSPPDRPG